MKKQAYIKNYSVSQKKAGPRVN